MSSLKKLIQIPKDKIVCLEYNQKKRLVTLGGDYKLSDLIWRIYIVCFEECDGEPQFHEVTRGKVRIQFQCSYKQYQKSLAHIVDEDYKLEETLSFNRLM